VLLSIRMISIIDQTSDAILHELKKKEVLTPALYDCDSGEPCDDCDSCDSSSWDHH